MISYRKAIPSDLESVVRLLESHKLPTSDVSWHIDQFVVAESEGQIVGSIGMEVYQGDALLRSLAVDKGFQGQGIGDALYQQLGKLAVEKGISTFHLLTTTAETYFGRRGFQLTDRAGSPASIQTTTEFSELCPSTARYMVRGIDG